MQNILINMKREDGDELYDYLKTQLLLLGVGIIKMNIKSDETYKIIKEAEKASVIVSGGEIWGESELSKLTTVRLITRMGTGVDNIDLEVAKRMSIAISNTAGANADAVAEGTVSMMLALSRKIVKADRMMRGFQWDPDGLSNSLINKNVGLIGFGHIGKRVFELLRGFSCTFYVYDPYCQEREDVNFVSLQELLEKSDFVSLHLPLNKHTRYFASDNFFASMKKGSFFINTSRGGVVDEKALSRALDAGEINGAALDVFEVEPSFNKSLIRENTILTPHFLSATRESAFYSIDVLVDNIKSFLFEDTIKNRIV